MLLVMEPVGQREARSLPEGHAAYDSMVRFGEDLRQKGFLKAYDSLSPTSKGTRVEVRNGKSSMVDGPFAEAKEIVGGYAVIDVPDLDAAIAMWRTWPAPDVCEIRPVVPSDARPDM